MAQNRSLTTDKARFRNALSESGLSREELAVRARVSYATVIRALSGESVSRFVGVALAKALRVRLEEIEAAAPIVAGAA